MAEQPPQEAAAAAASASSVVDLSKDNDDSDGSEGASTQPPQAKRQRKAGTSLTEVIVVLHEEDADSDCCTKIVGIFTTYELAKLGAEDYVINTFDLEEDDEDETDEGILDYLHGHWFEAGYSREGLDGLPNECVYMKRVKLDQLDYNDED